MWLVHILNVLAVAPVIFVVSVLQTVVALIKILPQKNNNTKNKPKTTIKTPVPSCLTDNSYGRHEFSQVNGVKLHYVECGDKSKPLMLFVHGFPEFWYSWRHQIKHFSKSYWVVAVDLRGYGDSSKPSGVEKYTVDTAAKDIYEFVTKGLNRNRCIYVGNDWGAAIGYKVTSEHPELVDKLIAINGTHPTSLQNRVLSSISQMWKSWYFILFILPWIPEMAFCHPAVDVFRKVIFSDSKKVTYLTQEELDCFKYKFSTPESWTTAMNYYRATFLPWFLFREIKYEKIKTPTLLLWGDADFALDTELAEMAKDQCEDLTVKYISGGCHFLQQHKPSEVNYWMENFLMKN